LLHRRGIPPVKQGAPSRYRLSKSWVWALHRCAQHVSDRCFRREIYRQGWQKKRLI